MGKLFQQLIKNSSRILPRASTFGIVCWYFALNHQWNLVNECRKMMEKYGVQEDIHFVNLLLLEYGRQGLIEQMVIIFIYPPIICLPNGL